MTDREVVERMVTMSVPEAEQKLEEAKATGNPEVVKMFEAVLNLAKSKEQTNNKK